MYPLKYSILDKMRPLIEQAKELEKQMHVKSKDQKSANWMLKTAQDAELELDEDLQYELHEKLGVKAQKLTEDGSLLAGSKLTQFTDAGNVHKKRADPVE